jgi:hypothetical protein
VDTKPSIRHSRNSLRPSMITAAVYHNLNSKKNTHTKQFLQQPKFQSPKKSQTHTLICKTPCFLQNSKSPTSKSFTPQMY